jgi:hypothetical protein
MKDQDPLIVGLIVFGQLALVAMVRIPNLGVFRARHQDTEVIVADRGSSERKPATSPDPQPEADDDGG